MQKRQLERDIEQEREKLHKVKHEIKYYQEGEKRHRVLSEHLAQKVENIRKVREDKLKTMYLVSLVREYQDIMLMKKKELSS